MSLPLPGSRRRGEGTRNGSEAAWAYVPSLEIGTSCWLRVPPSSPEVSNKKKRSTVLFTDGLLTWKNKASQVPSSWFSSYYLRLPKSRILPSFANIFSSVEIQKLLRKSFFRNILLSVSTRILFPEIRSDYLQKTAAWNSKNQSQSLLKSDLSPRDQLRTLLRVTHCEDPLPEKTLLAFLRCGYHQNKLRMSLKNVAEGSETRSAYHNRGEKLQRCARMREKLIFSTPPGRSCTLQKRYEYPSIGGGPGVSPCLIWRVSTELFKWGRKMLIFCPFFFFFLVPISVGRGVLIACFGIPRNVFRDSSQHVSGYSQRILGSPRTILRESARRIATYTRNKFSGCSLWVSGVSVSCSMFPGDDRNESLGALKKVPGGFKRELHRF